MLMIDEKHALPYALMPLDVIEKGRALSTEHASDVERKGHSSFFFVFNVSKKKEMKIAQRATTFFFLSTDFLQDPSRFPSFA